MRRLRLAVLFLPLVLLAATCVTSTSQRGTGGPWIVEVANTGDQPVGGVVARTTIEDAAGHRYPLGGAFTCPSTLAPHARGVAEIFFPTDIDPPPVAPLRAIAFDSVSASAPAPVISLDARMTQRNDAQRFVVVDVRNTGSKPAYNAEVCAILRAPDGQTLEVGHTDLFPSLVRPGDAQSVAIYFNSLPFGSIDLFATGIEVQDANVLLIDPSQINVETQRVIGAGADRHLEVAGSLRNTTGGDITNLTAMARIAGQPQTRVRAHVACDYGEIARDQTVPVTMSIPVPESIGDPTLEVLGIEGNATTVKTTQLPMTGVSFTNAPFLEGTSAVAVTGMVRNSTSSWVVKPFVCATFRDASGHVVGAVQLSVTSMSPYGMAPGESAAMRGIGVALAPVSTIAISAPAEPGTPPVTIPDAPLPAY